MRRVIALVLLAVIAAAGPGQGAVVSNFDAGLEGWLVTGDNDFQWQPAGGNPGGYLDVNDLATGAFSFAVAPPRFLGDWSAFTAADSL